MQIDGMHVQVSSKVVQDYIYTFEQTLWGQAVSKSRARSRHLRLRPINHARAAAAAASSSRVSSTSTAGRDRLVAGFDGQYVLEHLTNVEKLKLWGHSDKTVNKPYLRQDSCVWLF